MADILTAEPPAPAALRGQATASAPAESARYNATGDMIKARMPALVKGAGYATGANAPLTDPVDIMNRAAQATLDLRAETARGFSARSQVVKGFRPEFLNQFGALKTALTMPSIGEQIAQLVGGLPGGADALKSFTASNMGIGTVSGLVPFDLLAPSRLIYPVYTVN